MRQADHDTLLICFADHLSNLRELNRDREALGDQVWERFNQKDKEMQEWYYREIRSILCEEFDYESYEEIDEYTDLLYEVRS